MEPSRAEFFIDVWYGYATFHTKIVVPGCAAWYSTYVDWYRSTTVSVLVYWDFESFCPELEMRGPDSVQEATARELEQNSPNPTVDR